MMMMMMMISFSAVVSGEQIDEMDDENEASGVCAGSYQILTVHYCTTYTSYSTFLSQVLLRTYVRTYVRRKQENSYSTEFSNFPQGTTVRNMPFFGSPPFGLHTYDTFVPVPTRHACLRYVLYLLTVGTILYLRYEGKHCGLRRGGGGQKRQILYW